MKTFSEQRAWWENPVPAVGGFEAQEVIYGHQQRQESAAHRSDPLAQMRHNSNLSRARLWYGAGGASAAEKVARVGWGDG